MSNNEYEVELLDMDRYNYIKDTTGRTDPCIEDLLEGF